jgi:hypothetical protein
MSTDIPSMLGCRHRFGILTLFSFCHWNRIQRHVIIETLELKALAYCERLE